MSTNISEAAKKAATKILVELSERDPEQCQQALWLALLDQYAAPVQSAIDTETKELREHLAHEAAQADQLKVRLVRQAEEVILLRKIIQECLAAVPCGDTSTHTPENLAARVDELAKESARLSLLNDELVEALKRIKNHRHDPTGLVPHLTSLNWCRDEAEQALKKAGA